MSIIGALKRGNQEKAQNAKEKKNNALYHQSIATIEELSEMHFILLRTTTICLLISKKC